MWFFFGGGRGTYWDMEAYYLDKYSVHFLSFLDLYLAGVYKNKQSGCHHQFYETLVNPYSNVITDNEAFSNCLMFSKEKEC